MTRHALERDVDALAEKIGERNVTRPQAYAAAAQYIERQLRDAGYAPSRQTFDAGRAASVNIEASLAGTSNEIVVIGAHYDSVIGSPGADDNASGVAAMLALALAFSRTQPHRTLRFAAFANEEPPFFQTAAMGSFQYAKRCKLQNERVVAMLCLEAIAYFSDAPLSQQWPDGLESMYPSTGNFIAFASNLASQRLLHRSVGGFREHARVAAEGGALPEDVPGVGWSDQWAFWRFGYPAVMVTDTAPFRNPHYHAASDMPDTLDFERFEAVVDGLHAVVDALANKPL